jgi:hypothetical protein
LNGSYWATPLTSRLGVASNRGSFPPRDMHRPLQLFKHRGRKPTTKRADKASPLPTSWCFPHPTGTGSKPRGDFSPPATSLRGSKEPRCKGNPSTYLRRPKPVNKGGSSPTLRPTSPPQAEAPLSSCYSLDETSSAAYPRPNAFTLSASGRTIGNTSPCSRTIGLSYARSHSRSITGRRPPHLHFRGACPTSAG